MSSISRRSAVVLITALVGLASISVAGAAFGSSSSGSGSREDQRVLRLHTVLVSNAVNDAGHGGPGNVVALLFDLQRPGGADVGKAHISCTIVTSGVQLCHAGFVLPRGQIEAQASIPLTATTFTAAVVGGTGAYEGVMGEIRNVITAPGVVERTFFLMRADRD